MSRRLISVAPLLLVAGLGLATPRAAGDAPQLVAHEWGTFTSIAGEDGRAVEWRPLSGPPDLPCFVNQFGSLYKGQVSGLVRMETPVLYFYSPVDISVNVDVRFHQGYISEWFPRAAVTPQNVNPSALRRKDFSSGITWNDVNVSPADATRLPADHVDSHYYAARQTDAAPVTAGGDHEKFLFYRGVGSFEPPLTATLSKDGTLAVANPGGAAIGDVIRFDRRGDSVAYQVHRNAPSRTAFDRPAFDGESATPADELRHILVSHGLYPKEAAAMVETWRDSWFEPGSRLFYVAPRQAVDAILPLAITPAPGSIVRVFVGRIELGDRSTMPERMRTGTPKQTVETRSCR
jgi:hypothetical protein